MSDVLSDLGYLARFPADEGEEAADVFFSLRRLFGPGRPLAVRCFLFVPGAVAYLLRSGVIAWRSPLANMSRWRSFLWGMGPDSSWIIPAAWRGGVWG